GARGADTAPGAARRRASSLGRGTGDSHMNTHDVPAGEEPWRDLPPDEQPHPDYLRAHRGIASWLLTTDHKRIALMFYVAILISFALGGIPALMLRAELLTPERSFLDADTYNRMFTIHGVVMVFMFLVPGIPAIFGNFVLPMQLGAKDLAFPRLNLLSFY